jgi:hypothetical protein
MATDWNKVRDRVRLRIQANHNDLSTSTLARVAEAAGLRYTTLARFLHLHSGASRPTDRLQTRSLHSLAEALEVHPSWLREGQGTEQRGLWPHLVETEEELAELDPRTEFLATLETMPVLPRMVSLQICRSAVAAMLEAGAATGHLLPLPFYRLLMKLDATQQVTQTQPSGGSDGRNYA